LCRIYNRFQQKLLMIKVAIAGIGELVIKVAEQLREPDFRVTQFIISRRSSPAQVELLASFAKLQAIPVENNFDKLSDEDVVFTPNFQDLIKPELLNKKLFVNIHYALLPRFRGIHPVQAGLINGDKYFGYSIHQVDEGIDSGPVYFQYKYAADNNDTTDTINGKLTGHLVSNIARYLYDIVSGTVKPVAQDENKVQYVSRRNPQDGLINWSGKSINVHGLVRAVAPPVYDGAYTFYRNEKLIIAETSMVYCDDYIHTPGQVLCISNGRIMVKTGDKALWIEKVFSAGNIIKPMEMRRFFVGERMAMAPQSQEK
jgi:methionyl-tRNA formyltransferase